MAQSTTNTPIPQHVTALLSHLTSRPGVQSTFILSRKDGSIIQSTGLLATGLTRNSAASTAQPETQIQIQIPPATADEEPSMDPTAAAPDTDESLEPSVPAPAPAPATTPAPAPVPVSTAPISQEPYQPSQAEALAARVFAFVASASELGLSLSHPVENGVPVDGIAADGVGSSGTSREEGESEGVEREDEDEVKLLRLRTKKHEIVVVPDKKYLLCVVHGAGHLAGPGGGGVRSSR